MAALRTPSVPCRTPLSEDQRVKGITALGVVKSCQCPSVWPLRHQNGDFSPDHQPPTCLSGTVYVRIGRNGLGEYMRSVQRLPGR